jgi:hypothetical protein
MNFWDSGPEAHHSPPSSAEIKNGGTIPPLLHTSSCRSSCLIKQRDSFTFTFISEVGSTNVFQQGCISDLNNSVMFQSVKEFFAKYIPIDMLITQDYKLPYFFRLSVYLLILFKNGFDLIKSPCYDLKHSITSLLLCEVVKNHCFCCLSNVPVLCKERSKGICFLQQTQWKVDYTSHWARFKVLLIHKYTPSDVRHRRAPLRWYGHSCLLNMFQKLGLDKIFSLIPDLINTWGFSLWISRSLATNWYCDMRTHC